MTKITGVALAVLAAALLAAMPAYSASKQESFELFMEKGMMKLRQHDVDAAIDLLEQAEVLNPDDPEVLFFLGQAYEKTGDVNQSRAYFERVRDIAPGTEYGRVAREYLDAFEGEGTKRYFVNFRTGTQYDSNVILKPDTELLNTSGERTDWKWLFDIRGGYAVPVMNIIDLNLTYGFYQSLHFDLDDYNVQAHTFEAYPSYRRGPFTALAGYRHRYSYLDGDSYSADNGLFLKMSSKFADRFKAQAGFELTKKNNHRIEDRDATNRKYSGDLYYYYLDGEGLVKAGCFLAYESADASRFDYHGYGFRGSAGVPLPLDVDLMLDCSYEQRKYGERYSLRHRDFRDRKNYRFVWSVALEREVYEGLGVMLAYTRDDNRSTFEEYDYDRNLVTVYLTGRF